MNADRRKALSAIPKALQGLLPALSEAEKAVEGLMKDLQDLRDEEQASLDALPEALAEGEQATTMSDAIGKLDEANSELESFRDSLQSAEEILENVTASIEEAKGG